MLQSVWADKVQMIATATLIASREMMVKAPLLAIWLPLVAEADQAPLLKKMAETLPEMEVLVVVLEEEVFLQEVVVQVRKDKVTMELTVLLLILVVEVVLIVLVMKK